jgi:hypothetical protein
MCLSLSYNVSFLDKNMPENLARCVLSYTTCVEGSLVKTETNWVGQIARDFRGAKEKEVRLCGGMGTAKTQSAGEDVHQYRDRLCQGASRECRLSLRVESRRALGSGGRDSYHESCKTRIPCFVWTHHTSGMRT